MSKRELKAALRDYVNGSDDRLNEVRGWLHGYSPRKSQPVDYVRWVPIEQVSPNDYNPNRVAQIEMGLLLKSIEHDGYTQPIVTIWDEALQVYVIVDGFHRYYVMLHTPALMEETDGLLPIVVLDKTITERMASTVRHNRARGKHSMNGMANMVFSMLDQGQTDAEICNALGLEAEELLKLKHVTGFSKLYADAEYSRAWVTPNQIDVAHRHARETASA